MPVIYNSNKIIPAPLIAVSKTYSRLPGGEKLSVQYQITVTGNLVAYKGSPDSSENFWTSSGYPADETSVQGDPNARLEAILRKQEALRGLFAEDGHAFEIQPLNGAASMKCYPKVQSINFGEGQWYDLCQYTIVLTAEELLGTGDPEDTASYITSASESWSLQEGENEEIFTLSHNVSAQGVDQYGPVGLVNLGWVNAQTFVQALLGIDTDKIDSVGALNLDSGLLTGYNHTRVENLDEKAGTYSVAESWILSETDAIDNFNVDVTSSLTDPLNSVSINGTITGLNTKNGSFDITTNKFAAASGYYVSIAGDIFSRAQTYSNIALNAQALTETVGRNIKGGVITYNRTYNDRPSNIISEALSESVSVSEEFQGDIFAAIPVIGRAAGPILQNMNTKTQRSRSLTAQLTFTPSGAYGSPPSIQDIIDLVEPTATQVFRSQDNQNWDYKTGSLSRNITWVFSPDGG